MSQFVGRRTPGWTSGLSLLVLCISAWLVVRLGVALFPGDRLGAHFGRVLCSTLAVAALIAGGTTLLRRGGLPADRLGLKPTLAHARYFLLGIAGAILLVGLLAGALYVFVPFYWEPGRRSVADVFLDGHAYFWGNLAEELIFRGYAFVLLARAFGTQRALWLLAFAFGWFHLEGLGGLELARMIATTGAMHFVFAFAFLGTRTLWTAAGLHAAANVLLHSISGLSGKPALLQPILATPLASSDVTFWVFFGVAVAFAVALSQLPQVRAGAKWLEASNEEIYPGQSVRIPS